MNSAAEAPGREQDRKSSTLIEFPGVVRSSLPEWRRELSERVREVQERKAREAAIEADSAQLLLNDAPTHQLELLPQAEVPAINPLVAAALKRIERAHQPVATEDRRIPRAMTAVAYAPELEENPEPEFVEAATIPEVEEEEEEQTFELAAELDEPEVVVFEEPEPKLEKTYQLSVVTAPIVPRVNCTAPARRLIIDDPNDPALNYLDSIAKNLCIDELDQKQASRFRRTLAASIDFFFCAGLSFPIAGAIKLTGNSLTDNRAIIVIAASFIVVSFLYQTLTIALTGRTWAMRLLSLRIIDRKTGLIPTGGQAASRAILYLLSLAAAGLGILFALISRDGHTVHDQFTRTQVVIT